MSQNCLLSSEVVLDRRKLERLIRIPIVVNNVENEISFASRQVCTREFLHNFFRRFAETKLFFVLRISIRVELIFLARNRKYKVRAHSSMSLKPVQGLSNSLRPFLNHYLIVCCEAVRDPYYRASRPIIRSFHLRVIALDILMLRHDDKG